MQRLFIPIVSSTFGLVAWLVTLGAADDYTQHIKPLLTEKCIACHGPLRSEAGLRLDAAELIRKGSDEHAIVVVGQPADSHLIQRVTSADEEQLMPPKGEGVRLKPDEVQLLERWIKAGMPAPEDESYVASPREHWAYRPIERPQLPHANAEANVQEANAIDRWLSMLQYQRGVQRNDSADPATWLRRVTLDLTGLPPSIEQLEAFLSNAEPDARGRAVDRLLASPAHGQRWGRHWMDVWRYSDWDGYKNELRGSQRHIWHWRDWIIESIDADKPYDQMVVEMLAADEIDPQNLDTLRATGFLARNFHRSNRNIWLDATVEHTAKAFLGMTINCARCHDHKFDPISQTEYYQFRAIFEPHEVRTEELAGQPDLMKAGIPRVFDAKPEAKTFLFERGNDKQPRQDQPIQPSVPALFDIEYQPQSIALPRQVYQPALTPVARANALAAAWSSYDKARQAAETKLKKLRERTSTEQPNSAANIPADEQLDPITAATLEAHAAEAALVSLQARYAADLAKLDEVPQTQLDPLVKQAATTEQRANLLAAQVALHSAHNALATAKASENKDAKKRQTAIDQAEKNLVTQRQALDQARLASSVAASTYTPVGTVYPAASTGRRTALARWITNPRHPLTARVAVNHIWMRHFATPLVDDVADLGLRMKQPITHQLIDWLADDFMSSDWDMKRLHRQIVMSETYGLSSHVDNSSPSSVAALQIDSENKLYWRGNVRRLDAEEIRDSLLAVSGHLDNSAGGPDLSEDDGEQTPRRSVYFRHAYEKQVAMLVLFDGASPIECYRRSPSIIPQQALALANSQMARNMSRQLGEQLHKQHPDSKYFINQLFLAALGRQPSDDEQQTCALFLAERAEGETELVRRQSLAHAMINHNDFVVAR
ncbi:MAG: DUF1549 domain-containing protein [Pirellulaceae bacterium]|nr:DUF1549 domain-containing protein [Pirellulaceae bacterium]